MSTSISIGSMAKIQFNQFDSMESRNSGMHPAEMFIGASLPAFSSDATAILLSSRLSFDHVLLFLWPLALNRRHTDHNFRSTGACECRSAGRTFHLLTLLHLIDLFRLIILFIIQKIRIIIVFHSFLLIVVIIMINSLCNIPLTTTHRTNKYYKTIQINYNYNGWLDLMDCLHFWLAYTFLIGQ